MFFIVNRQKVYTYLVSIVTVVLLFCVAGTINHTSGKGDTIQTASTTQRLLPIYNVQTEEKKVAFTMNCAWNADDIESILKTLQDNNVKITFFMVGDWIEKYPEAAKKIHEAGHEIASHSDTHPHVNNLSYEKNIEEIEKSNDKIEKITGKFLLYPQSFISFFISFTTSKATAVLTYTFFILSHTFLLLP